jgi:hypothetical protein
MRVDGMLGPNWTAGRFTTPVRPTVHLNTHGESET